MTRTKGAKDTKKRKMNPRSMANLKVKAEEVRYCTILTVFDSGKTNMCPAHMRAFKRSAYRWNNWVFARTSCTQVSDLVVERGKKRRSIHVHMAGIVKLAGNRCKSILFMDGMSLKQRICQEGRNAWQAHFASANVLWYSDERKAQDACHLYLTKCINRFRPVDYAPNDFAHTMAEDLDIDNIIADSDCDDRD